MEDKTFFEDFRKFQDECPKINLNAEASIPTKKGGIYKFKYADLGGILDVVRPILSKNNLMVYWTCNLDGSVTCVLCHGFGKIESTCHVKAGDDPKQQGAAITYAKRYSLVALLGIVAEEDKDAPEPKKKIMSTKLFNDACKRIEKGDMDVIKDCLLYLNVSEEQKEKLVELEFQYNG